MRHLVRVAVLSAFLAAQCSSAAAAVTLEPIGDFVQPISISSDPNNPQRLLVGEREGAVVEVTGAGTKQLVDLRSLVTCCESERGLLSFAPAPDFASSGRLYIAYTGTPAAGGAEGDVHVDSFRPGPGGAGGVIREPILSVAHALNPNHNGGQLQFGPDGHLYVSLGDGGGGGDPLHSGQDTKVLLGKVLRIDPRPGQDPPYAIPAGNPFAESAGRVEIWAYGLRNPWRFSFDRATGDMVIGDVGQDAREEIDYAPSPGGGVVSGAGANYGWNCREGFIAYPSAPGGCGPASSFSEPVFDYPHDDPMDGSTFGCSIIGGYVVRDPSLGDLYGRYLYTDYCGREIRSLVLPGEAGGLASDDRSEGLAVAKPTSFGEDSCGRLYVASDEGTVYRFRGEAPAVCPSIARDGQVGQAGSGSGQSSQSGGKRGQLHRSQLLLSAKRLRPEGLRFKLKVRLDPCRNGVGQPVQLNRSGKSFATKALSGRCRARFFVTVAEPTPIRAFVRLSDEAGRVGSKRLVLSAPKQP